jgi:uncharacterized protein (DUF2062 family)
MTTRIAIVVLPGPGRAMPTIVKTSLPPTCIIVEGINPPAATPTKGDASTAPAVPGRLLGTHLRNAATRARALEATHLMVLRQWPPTILPDIQKMVAACQAHPDALVIGWRPPALVTGWRRRWIGRRWPRFWLKMQTGRHLRDPLCALRLYPLAVIENLRLYQRGSMLGAEILVKSAWAGVPFHEVAVDTAMAVHHGEPSSLGEPIWRFLLNVHYALRSVLPVPHRKLVPDADQAGSKVSVWRPMRSLRTLLRENTSPTQLALAAAVGVFLGTLPLIACHTLVIILAANYFRLNKVAALASSQLCMPPVVPALCIEAGYFMRHGRFLTEISLETLGYQALERLYEWLLGSLVLAPLLALLIGGMTLMMARLAARSMAAVRNLGSGAG